MLVLLKSRLAYGFVYIAFILFWKSFILCRKICYACEAQEEILHYETITEANREKKKTCLNFTWTLN
jgi:hypothetical protein